MKSSINGDILHQGNSIVSIEILSDYSQPVVVKQPSKRRTSKRIPGSLEREYEMTRTLNPVEGVRKTLGEIQKHKIIHLDINSKNILNHGK
jgi:hypothetical protein